MNHIKTLILLLCFMLIVVYLPSKSHANHTNEESYDLMKDVYTVYELAIEGKFTAASTKLEHVLEAISSNHLDVSKEKLQYISDKVENSIVELESDALTEENKLENVFSFMLMMETAENPKNEMYSKMKNDLKSQILNSLESDTIGFEREYFETVELYQTLLPALKIEYSYESWELLEDQLTSMVKMDNPEQMENDLNVLLNIFEPMEVTSETEKEDDSSFLWLITTVGGTIIFTLFYVGWRKYKGEKKNKEKYKKVDGY